MKLPSIWWASGFLWSKNSLSEPQAPITMLLHLLRQADAEGKEAHQGWGRGDPVPSWQAESSTLQPCTGNPSSSYRSHQELLSEGVLCGTAGCQLCVMNSHSPKSPWVRTEGWSPLKWFSDVNRQDWGWAFSLQGSLSIPWEYLCPSQTVHPQHQVPQRWLCPFLGPGE